MGERCELLLDKAYYYPGDTINGFVICYFNLENKVRDICVRFRGEAEVYWKVGNARYSNKEQYFEMESNLLTSETTFQPGNYSFPFVFNLPANLPSSVIETNSNIKYEVKTTVDRPWAPDYTAKKRFFVYSYINLNDMPSLKDPAEFSAQKQYLFSSNSIIKIVVKLPKTGYIPGEMISFTCSVINNSNIKVKDVHFSFCQSFELIAESRTIQMMGLEGQTFAIINGAVLPFSEHTWDLQIRVPGNVYNGNIRYCKIIKACWELRGEVRLPLLYTNIKISVPITIGSVPFITSSQ